MTWTLKLTQPPVFFLLYFAEAKSHLAREDYKYKMLAEQINVCIRDEQLLTVGDSRAR